MIRPVCNKISGASAKVTSVPVPANVEYTGEATSTLTDAGAAENGTMKYAVSDKEDVQPD